MINIDLKISCERFRKRTYSCQGERIIKEFGKVMYTLLYSKWITNKDLLYGIWNSIYSMLCASLVDGGWGGWRFAGKWIHVYVWLSPFAVHLKQPQHCSLAMHACVLNHFSPVWLWHYGCSLPGSSVHGIFQAKILESIAIPFFRGSSQPISLTSPALVGGFFTTSDTWEARIP